ncbi:aminodeoxychorismate lyase [Motiliproteus coralliicola]|uniref:Aminodeoxychorismate lyase n=1 Tax=Motiliproteus coralliicola TaxID=2283196 RepID=A0A369WSR5_9GAMM|nr:aminodeoxychorismate lyase [Motiliproteus coralliicola]RDE24717.1 aminodeoxychorismate lyase [Motiliproteus coralliicola]
MSECLINGRPSAVVGVTDRGFSYGDGLFETLRFSGGRPLLFERHLQRMQQGLQRLSILEAGLLEQLRADVDQMCRGQSEGLLKIQVSRGEGGRGYRGQVDQGPTRVVQRFPAPVYPGHWFENGAELFRCQTRLGLCPQLAGIKHMNRLEQVLARSEWHDQFPEGIVCDLDGYVVEGTMSNLFMIRNGVLFTPKLDRCGVAGIVRSVIMDAAEGAGVELHETRIRYEQLAEADGLFMTNTGFGVLPVKSIADQRYPLHPLTDLASQWLEEARRCES